MRALRTWVLRLGSFGRLSDFELVVVYFVARVQGLRTCSDVASGFEFLASACRMNMS